MAANNKTLPTIVKFRTGTSAEYEAVKDKFIPLKGELSFVNTTDAGTRMKLGDGTSSFGKLPFIDEYLLTLINNIIIRGYLYDGSFYQDEAHTKKYVPYSYKLYIDIPSNLVYSCDGTNYISSAVEVAQATESVPGIMKLYQNTGKNTDGTMTQKSITDNLNTKFKVSIDDDECIVFNNN